MTAFAATVRAAAVKPLLMISAALAIATQAIASGPELPKYTADELKAREARFSREINIGTASAEKLSIKIREFLKVDLGSVQRTGDVKEIRSWDQALTAIGVTGPNASLKSWKPVLEVYRAHMLEQDAALTRFRAANPSGTQDAFWKTMPNEWTGSSANYKFMTVSKAFVGQNEEWEMAVGFEAIAAGEGYKLKTVIYPNDMLKNETYLGRMAVSNPQRTLESVANWIDEYKGYSGPVSDNKPYFDYLSEEAIKKATVGRYASGPEQARNIIAALNPTSTVFINNAFQAAMRPPPAGFNNSRGVAPGG